MQRNGRMGMGPPNPPDLFGRQLTIDPMIQGPDLEAAQQAILEWNQVGGFRPAQWSEAQTWGEMLGKLRK